MNARGMSLKTAPMAPHAEPRPGSASRGGVIPVIVAYLALLSLIPPVLVLPGLGAAGRPASVFCLGLLLWWAYTRALPQSRPHPYIPIRWAMIAYLLAAMVSTAAGQGRGAPGDELLSMDRSILLTLGFVGLILTMIDGVRSVDDIERILRWAVYLGAFSAVVAIVQFIFRFDPVNNISVPGLERNSDELGVAVRGRAGYARVRGIARHPIEFGVVAATMLPIGLSLLTAGTRSRRPIAIATALLAVTIPMSISRSAIIGVVIGLLVVSIGWTWRQRAHAMVIGTVGLVAFQAITPGLLGTIRSLFERLGSDNSVTGRTEDYGAVSDYVSERPWFGRGTGTFLIERYRVLDNEYLGTLIEMGFVGLTALVILLLSGVTTAWRVRVASTDERTRALALALAATIAIAIVAFATFDALFFPIYSGLLMLMLGCLGALDRLNPAAARWGRVPRQGELERDQVHVG